MRRFVVDTSALVRLYVPDGPLPEGLESAVASAWRTEAMLFVPDLALVELAQVLWKKEQRGHLTADEADAIRAAATELPLDVVGHRELLDAAVALAREHRLTVYDAIFLALARSRGAELISADADLLAASGR